MKFDNAIKEHLDLLKEAPGVDPTVQDPGTDPNAPPQSPNMNPQTMSATPAQPNAQPREEQPLTSEGKRYAVEIALNALSFNPEQIPSDERDLFNEEVTRENAEHIFGRIERIVTANVSAASTAEYNEG